MRVSKLKQDIYDSMNDIMTDETPQNAQNGGGIKMTPNNQIKTGKPQLK